jgi:DNA-binding transcriptional LysR family regulator
LRLFEAAGRLGSISRAANECGLTQPAATQSLASLAQKVGVALLVGGARGSTLTLPGRELHARARALLHRLDEGLRQIAVVDREEAIWRITPVQLQLIDAMRERGSLDHALVVTNLTARPARRALHALEALVGRAIVTRGAGTTALNPCGMLLARHVGLLASETEWTVRNIRVLAAQSERRLVVGVAPDPGTAGLDATVRAFTTRFPDWCIEVIEAGQNDLLARLAIGEIDFVVGHMIGDPVENIVWEEIATASFHIVARKDHPLAAKKSVALRELAREKWVFGAGGSTRRAASDALFPDHPQPACIVVTSAAPLMAHVLVERDCLGLMTEQELKVRQSTLARVAHAAAPTLARIGVATRAEWEPRPVQAGLLALLRHEYAQPALG